MHCFFVIHILLGALINQSRDAFSVPLLHGGATFRGVDSDKDLDPRQPPRVVMEPDG